MMITQRILHKISSGLTVLVLVLEILEIVCGRFSPLSSFSHRAVHLQSVSPALQKNCFYYNLTRTKAWFETFH